MEASRAQFRFYGELNDHLAASQRYETLEKAFFVPSGAKDLIESFGVPHTEVELIVANGESVDFSYVVRDRDRIAVYPMFESVDVTPELRVRTKTLRTPKFVLDVHLGKLAAYLRMLGFDTVYRNTFGDPELVRISVEEERILLTRGRGLLKHGAVTRGYWLRETDSRRQISEILRRFDLAGSVQPFSRCMRCNGVLRPVSRELAHNRLANRDQVRRVPLSSGAAAGGLCASNEQVYRSLPARTAELPDELQQCPGCGRIYWKGSHHARMLRWIEELTSVH